MVDGGRHAYLLMAHAQFDMLAKLLRALDHDRHDIYLHVDARAGDYPRSMVEAAVQRSSLTFIERRRVSWGAFSAIACELDLLQAATSAGAHRYYHLLSGMDLPLRSADGLLAYFDGRQLAEYVHLSPRNEWASVRYRVGLYHPLQERLMTGGLAVDLAAKVVSRAQRALRVDRTRGLGELPLAFGAAWFSITDDLARHTLERRDWIEDTFRSSQCADEMFMQTVALSSPYAERVTGDALRKVDWSRGDVSHPHVWRSEDLPELMAAPELFARKFDARVDPIVIDALLLQVAGRR